MLYFPTPKVVKTLEKSIRNSMVNVTPADSRDVMNNVARTVKCPSLFQSDVLSIPKISASCKWNDAQCAMCNFSQLYIYRLYTIGAYLDVRASLLRSAEYIALVQGNAVTGEGEIHGAKQ